MLRQSLTSDKQAIVERVLQTRAIPKHSAYVDFNQFQMYTDVLRPTRRPSRRGKISTSGRQRNATKGDPSGRHNGRRSNNGRNDAGHVATRPAATPTHVQARLDVGLEEVCAETVSNNSVLRLPVERTHRRSVYSAVKDIDDQKARPRISRNGTMLGAAGSKCARKTPRIRGRIVRRIVDIFSKGIWYMIVPEDIIPNILTNSLLKNRQIT